MHRNILRALALVIISKSGDFIPLVIKLLVIDLKLMFANELFGDYCKDVLLTSDD
jgi:hypothetical protein